MHELPPMTAAQQIAHTLRNELAAAKMTIEHLKADVESVSEMLHDQEQVTIRLMAELETARQELRAKSDA